jgi:hypothetical protein
MQFFNAAANKAHGEDCNRIYCFGDSNMTAVTHKLREYRLSSVLVVNYAKSGARIEDTKKALSKQCISSGATIILHAGTNESNIHGQAGWSVLMGLIRETSVKIHPGLLIIIYPILKRSELDSYSIITGQDVGRDMAEVRQSKRGTPIPLYIPKFDDNVIFVGEINRKADNYKDNLHLTDVENEKIANQILLLSNGAIFLNHHFF